MFALRCNQTQLRHHRKDISAHQGAGHDAKGRKQYRYHPHWHAARDEAKYERMMSFGETLPKIRERVERDLGKHGLTRERVLATIVCLLETDMIRVGNKEYAEEAAAMALLGRRLAEEAAK